MQRFELEDKVKTTIETLLGQQTTVKWRYYLDTKTEKFLFLLDGLLVLRKNAQMSPSLDRLLLHQAVLSPSYRAADSREEFF